MGAENDGTLATEFNNAGGLTGVTVINEPHAYSFQDRSWRNAEWTMSGATIVSSGAVINPGDDWLLT